MTKVRPDGIFNADSIAWIPWEERRSMPFRIHGAKGNAWVKVLAREPETGAETLLYRFDPGWSADRLEVTAPENMLVCEGGLTAGEHVFKPLTYAYRPTGYEIGPCATESGATVISIAWAPSEPLASKVPVDALDTETIPWVRKVHGKEFKSDKVNGQKVLRADEENLSVFILSKSAGKPHIANLDSYTRPEQLARHEAPEEGFFLEGKTLLYDRMIDGPIWLTKGSYMYRPACSGHWTMGVVEDQLVFSHRIFALHHEGQHGIQDAIEEAEFPVETSAVKAIKEGRDPGIPLRW